MSLADTVRSDWDKIFTGSLDFGKFLSSISAADGEPRCIDAWLPDSTDMLPTKQGSGNSATSIRMVPRIKVKTERNWIRGEIKKWFEEHLEEIQNKVTPYLPSDKDEVYNWEIFEKVMSGTGLPSLLVTATKEGGNRSRPAFKFLVQPKGLTAGAAGQREDPHELMTAILIRLQKKVVLGNINRKKDDKRHEAYKELVDELAANANKVVGGSGLNGFYIDGSAKNEPDLVNLAKALSVSNFILQKIGKNATVNAVWQTGKQWANEISKFNPDSKDIKNYNSSDIIVKFTTTGSKGGVHYWGISLKKKGITDAEPTLLNKPLMGARGFISKKMEKADRDVVDNAKKDFFVRAIQRKLNGGNLYKGKNVSAMSLKDVLKTANSLFLDSNEKSDMLTGRGEYRGIKNTYFEALHIAFMSVVGHNAAGKVVNKKKAEEFSKEFMDLIFKINMDQYVNDANFHFSLITGVGDYKSSKVMQVKPPIEKEGRTTSEIFKKLWEDPENVSYRFIPGRANSGAKKMAFEEGATAAKLFYELKIGPPRNEHSIVMLEVRYKGALTSEPQFQVFMSTRPNSFSALYKKVAKAKGSSIRRW